jgi:general secretion pathway protein C
MAVRFWSWLVWALVGASAVGWALKLLCTPRALPPQAIGHGPHTLPVADLTRLLVGNRPPAGAAGARVQEPAPHGSESRLQLVGVLSRPGEEAVPAQGRGGLALITVDGKPPRLFAVGDAVDGQRVLLRVAQRRADIGLAGQAADLTLEIAAPVVAVPGQGRAAAAGAAQR